MSIPRLLIGFSLMLSTACSSSRIPEYVCTLGACSSSLTIKLRGGDSETYSITLKSEFRPDEVFTCPNPSPLLPNNEQQPYANYRCEKDSLVIPNFLRERVEATYRAGTKTVTRALKTVYVDQQPEQDGRCGKCLDGQAELVIDEAAAASASPSASASRP